MTTESVLWDTAQMTEGEAVLFVKGIGTPWDDVGDNQIQRIRPKWFTETNMKEPGRVPAGYEFRVAGMLVTVNGEPPPSCSYYVEVLADTMFPIGHLAENAGRLGGWTLPAGAPFYVRVYGPRDSNALIRVFITGCFASGARPFR